MIESGLETMRRWCLETPSQLTGALARARALGWPSARWFGEADTGPIFLGGMGGSASACRLAHAALGDQLSMPCVIQSDPVLPRWIGPGTRVAISSYSGESWEALAMFDAAAERGARLLAVACGGRLASDARLDPAALFRVPEGYAPRAALGWMVVPLMLALAGPAAPAVAERIARAAELISDEMSRWERGEGLPGRNPRSLAARLQGRRIFLYALGDGDRAITGRWRNVFNENAKRLAHEGYFPELVHAEIVGWGDPTDGAPSVVLVLDDPTLADGTRGRVVAAAEAELSGRGVEWIRVPANGADRVERVLSHVALGDYLSLELASQSGVDPMPIEAITRVKAAAAGTVTERNSQ